MARRVTLVSLTLFFLFGGVLAADEAGVAVEEVEVPADVQDAVKDVLRPSAYTITVDGEKMGHLWVREGLPTSESGSSELGVSFGEIKEGGLVGVLHLLTQWSDYKTTPIQPGTYTLRYGIMPQDGAHMGVATYRDFLILIPAAQDKDPGEAYEMAGMLTASSEVTGVPHPAVLALYPIWEDVSEPKIVENDLGQPTLALKFNGKVVGFVVQGHGEI